MKGMKIKQFGWWMALGSAFLAISPGAKAVIVSETLDQTVEFGVPGNAFYALDLPGAELDFATSAFSEQRQIVVLAGSGQIQLHLDQNNFWAPSDSAQVAPSSMTSQLSYATVVSSQGGPATYEHKYLTFEFKDTTDGDRLKPGWIELSAAQTADPFIHIEGFGYENGSGATSGGISPVPEPEETAKVVGAALAMSAAGLRGWRRRQIALAGLRAFNRNFSSPASPAVPSPSETPSNPVPEPRPSPRASPPA